METYIANTERAIRERAMFHSTLSARRHADLLDGALVDRISRFRAARALPRPDWIS